MGAHPVPGGQGGIEGVHEDCERRSISNKRIMGARVLTIGERSHTYGKRETRINPLTKLCSAEPEW